SIGPASSNSNHRIRSYGVHDPHTPKRESLRAVERNPERWRRPPTFNDNPAHYGKRILRKEFHARDVLIFNQDSPGAPRELRIGYSKGIRPWRNVAKYERAVESNVRS